MADIVPTSGGLAPLWVHEDASGISEAATRGLNRAIRRDWSSGTRAERLRDLRGLLVFRAWVAARLTGAARLETGPEGGRLAIAPVWAPGSSDRQRAVELLGRSNIRLADAVGGFDTWTPPELLQTGRQGEAGALPLAVVAIVSVVSGVTMSAALAYCASQAAQLIENHLARSSAAAELARADALVVELLDKHVAAEEKAGKRLELSDAARRVLETLEARQEQMANASASRGAIASGLPTLPDWALPAGAAIIGVGLWLAVALKR